MSNRWPLAVLVASAPLLAAPLATHAERPPGAPTPAAVHRAQEAASAWRPLFDGRTLEGWEETPFGGEGLIHVRDGAIVLEFGEPMTGITYTGDLPRTGYELRLSARRLGGSDFFCGLTVPVGDAHVSLILGGWGGALVGLSNIDGQDASGNETTQYVRFEDERWYAVRLRVTAARIETWLDEQRLIDVAIAGRTIDVRPEMLLSRPLGIASYRTRAAVRDIAIRPLGP